MGEESGDKSETQEKPPAITQNQEYKELIMRLEGRGQFPPHPKMEKLKSLILEHFMAKDATDEARGPAKPNPNTRVMVFTTYRDCVKEIVEYLNLQSPIIKATKFIGQDMDKGGGKGFTQKEQLGVCPPLFLSPAVSRVNWGFKGNTEIQNGRIQRVGVNFYW